MTVAIFAAFGADVVERAELGDPVPTLVVVVVIAIGEEYGWRGFALPRLLQRTDPWRASLILGIVWWLWHAPAALLVGVGTPEGIPLVGFAPFVLGVTAVSTGLRLYAPSTSLAVALHVGVNLANGLTPVLPESIGGATGPFWLFTSFAALAGLVAITVSRHGEIRGPNSAIDR